ncbi:MAG: CYTH domain-containing protein [Gammaproteobacteria bacterium]|nr:CYTH domain-containing protein [Gammaproteobacteria bacterium]
MAEEIERKFLVIDDRWRDHVEQSIHQIQGYLGSTESCSIRVRIAGDKASLNIKSATLGITRREYDYPILLDEAREILDELCVKPLIEKTRHIVRVGRHKWEIDEFAGDNSGLIVAEIELASADEAFRKPTWAGDEVSDDPRYYNVCLVEHPYKDWEDG